MALRLKSLIRKMVEKLIGREIIKFGGDSIAIIRKENWKANWFIYPAQIKTILENYNIDLVIDVGANEGQFAQKIRKYYSGEIISFEPVSRIFDKLEKNAQNDNKWQVFNFGLGSKESIQTINVSDDTVFSSLYQTNEFCEQRFGNKSRGTEKEDIQIRRLDIFLNSSIPNIAGRKIFLKMDTQGYDLETFKGADTILKNIFAIQSEVSVLQLYEGVPNWTESISIYEAAGFRVAGLFPVTWDSFNVIEYDCLMTKSTNNTRNRN